MMSNSQEILVEKTVTYTLEVNGKFILIENVPVRVNEETGEQFFTSIPCSLPSPEDSCKLIIVNFKFISK